MIESALKQTAWEGQECVRFAAAAVRAVFSRVGLPNHRRNRKAWADRQRGLLSPGSAGVMAIDLFLTRAMISALTNSTVTRPPNETADGRVAFQRAHRRGHRTRRVARRRLHSGIVAL